MADIGANVVTNVWRRLFNWLMGLGVPPKLTEEEMLGRQKKAKADSVKADSLAAVPEIKYQKRTDPLYMRARKEKAIDPNGKVNSKWLSKLLQDENIPYELYDAARREKFLM